MITISFNNRTPDLNDLVEFNITVYHPNGTTCTKFQDNIYTRPSEIIDSDVNEENITGIFTVTENGLYSLVVNIKDSDGNWIKRKYMFLVNTDQTRITNYYIRPDVEPTHGQPSKIDSKSLLLEAPKSESDFTCSVWIQASPDNISTTPLSYLKDINISHWYNSTVGITPYVGVQRYVDFSSTKDYQDSLSAVSEWTWSVNNFTQLNWSLDYAGEWYWLAIKLSGISPYWYTNQTHPSYVNISYVYSDKPEIKELSNTDDVILLSATSPSSEENNATIYLEGTGTTNLTVQMPNSLDYNASYNGVYCDDSNANCNLSQSAGELEFALSLGSEHNITIWTEEGSQTYECDSCSDCNTKIGDASSGDTVKLNTSLSDVSGTCIDFNGKDSVTFNCMGYTIDGDSSGDDSGILFNSAGGGSNNNIIRNCTITDFENKICIDGSYNNTITNNTFKYWGSRTIYATNGDNNTITNNIFESNEGEVLITSGSSYNVFEYNTFENTTDNAMIIISSFNNISHNTISNQAYKGIYMWGADNCTVRNNTITSSGTYAIHLFSGATGNNITNNTMQDSIINGLYLQTDCNNNTITNNIISKNRYGIYVKTSSNNTIDNNLLEKNKIDVYIEGISSDTFTNNQFFDNAESKMINSTSFNKREADLNDLVEFNISVYYPNGTACTSFTDNTYTRPSETIDSDTNGENITGNFTVDENGLYSLVVNITDPDGNWVKRKYAFFVNTTQTYITSYYLRPDVQPIHGQPVGGDAKSLLFEAPTSASNFTCGSWVQASPDNISTNFSVYVKSINISSWYKATNYTYIGIQYFVTYGSDTDTNKQVPNSTNYLLNKTNFTQLNWTLDYPRDWYWLVAKLYSKAGDPYWKTNQTDPSYINISYALTTKPEIKKLTNEDVLLLSATSPSSEENNATIYLEGTGTTNLTVQMPNSLDYNASYNEVYCDDSNTNCNLSQSAGELEFALSLGSEHNITIWTEEGLPQTYECDSCSD
ncbi:MAG: right-handed parallel beta-helix repeat-containing protein, partial [Candidatus Aenigmarchaeota archaeon]|nr:right-handed parallel beta-helix repeat-containing protein [Candidatus Aenigmarchaeota archaeon]